MTEAEATEILTEYSALLKNSLYRESEDFEANYQKTQFQMAFSDKLDGERRVNAIDRAVGAGKRREFLNSRLATAKAVLGLNQQGAINE
jgi:hypothetical protein